MQLWASRPLGCSGLVVLVVLDGDSEQPEWTPGAMPRATWLIDRAAADLAAEMLHDAVEAQPGAGSDVDVDIDAIIERAVRATGPRPG